MRFDTLSAWLSWQEGLHPREIELGLPRVAEVARRLGIAKPRSTLVTVGGTNGKGSTVTMLDSLYRAAGYKVGRYTSPHLLQYNERIAIQDTLARDEELCAAFEAIEGARGDISLTYFEFGTLAAMWLFERAGVDIALLEVGLGGRLDAVNIWDADVAVITSVDLDHMQWLGDTRDKIGFEKAGIFRAGRPAVCGDPDPPASVMKFAQEIGADLYVYKRDFDAIDGGQSWHWRGPRDIRRNSLPWPSLRGRVQLQNASVVLTVASLLQARHAVTAQDIRNALFSASLPGRFQILPGRIPVVLDVAHNPQAARNLAQNLRSMACQGKTHAVFSVLSDKDIAGIIGPMHDVVTLWYVGELTVPRAASGGQIRQAFAQNGLQWTPFDSVAASVRAALACANEGDRIVVFGSFYTVTEAMAILKEKG